MSDSVEETAFVKWYKGKTAEVVDTLKWAQDGDLHHAADYLEALLENAFLSGCVHALEASNERIRRGGDGDISHS